MADMQDFDRALLRLAEEDDEWKGNQWRYANAGALLDRAGASWTALEPRNHGGQSLRKAGHDGRPSFDLIVCSDRLDVLERPPRVPNSHPASFLNVRATSPASAKPDA
jgi:hypothetical protein